MSRTYRVLLVAIVALGAVGGYWKLVLAPKREKIAQLDEQVASAQAQLAQTQQLIATYKGARDAYKTNYDTVVRLGKAVPTDDDTRSLVVQIDAAAKRSGVNRLSSWRSPEFAAAMKGAGDNFIPVALESLEQDTDVDWRPRVPQWPAIGETMATAVQAALVGQKKPKEALDEAQARIAQILKA